MELTLILAPLSFLSGIGLIILSTSRRYIELIRQLQHIIEGGINCSREFMVLQKKRLWMFKWALSLLYLCVGFVLVGSLAGGLSLGGITFTTPLLYGAVILSVISALAAIVILIRESFVSASLIDEQHELPRGKPTRYQIRSYFFIRSKLRGIRPIEIKNT